MVQESDRLLAKVEKQGEVEAAEKEKNENQEKRKVRIYIVPSHLGLMD